MNILGTTLLTKNSGDFQRIWLFLIPTSLLSYRTYSSELFGVKVEVKLYMYMLVVPLHTPTLSVLYVNMLTEIIAET